MCIVPDNLRRNSSQNESASMDNGDQNQKTRILSCSVLLELAACNDLPAFKKAVEEDGMAIDEASLWYCRKISSSKMSFEERTPLMMAATFGCLDVMKYILSHEEVDVNRACGSDGVTALHCAVFGGSNSASETVKMLIEANANVNSLDAYGNRPGDVFATASQTSQQKSLEIMLESVYSGTGDKEQTAAYSQNIGCLDENLQLVEEQISEKKEFPVDFSMPDINSGIYGTDEFRMFTFKVKPCSRAYSHDWTECPFVHPGENARRRDPLKYSYSCVPCPEFRKGTCRLGDACEYAHGVFESWLHPWQYRTRPCKDETGCTRKVCFFAHKPEELRPFPASGSTLLSPRSSSAGVLSLDMAALNPSSLGSPSMMMLPTSTAPTSPSSPSWQNHSGTIPPALQLPASRFKPTLSARDMDMEMKMVALEDYQLMDGISNLSGQSSTLVAASSGSRSGKFGHVGTVSPSNLEAMFGSVDASTISQLQGISLKAAATVPQFQSPGVHQGMNQKMHSGYGNNSLSSSPARTTLPSASFGLDPSLAAAMNPRAASFANRSQSFSERMLMNHHHGLMPTATTAAMLSDWGSPNGKVDWGIDGDELNKLRKSASFGIRSNGSSSIAAPSTTVPINPADGLPDFTWALSPRRDSASTCWTGLQQPHYLDSGVEFHTRMDQ
ncbi:hypothetical protein ACLOJK_031707 [Asimina triloba]